MSVIIMLICPPRRSLIASGLLLYGTCRSSMPAICWNISPATRDDELPLPKLILPGCDFASAMNSATIFAGTFEVDDHDLPALAEPGDRQVVLHRVVGNLLEQVLVRGVRRVGRDEHRVAVGRRLLHRFGADEARRAGLVVDDHRLLGDARDLLPERARELVGGAAGRERHDERELLVGILGVRERAEAGEHDGKKALRSIWFSSTPIVTPLAARSRASAAAPPRASPSSSRRSRAPRR